MNRGVWWATVHGVTNSQTRLSDFHFSYVYILILQSKYSIVCMLLNVAEVVLYGMGFPSGEVVQNTPTNAGDVRNEGSVPGSGKSPGVGNGSPLRYSGFENSMDR